jgi:hypothetical protein
MGIDFALVGTRRIFHAADKLRLMSLSLFDEFFHAFRIDDCVSR